MSQSDKNWNKTPKTKAEQRGRKCCEAQRAEDVGTAGLYCLLPCCARQNVPGTASLTFGLLLLGFFRNIIFFPQSQQAHDIKQAELWFWSWESWGWSLAGKCRSGCWTPLFSWVGSAMCRGGEWPTAESGSGLDSETHPPGQKSRSTPEAQEGRANSSPSPPNNSSGHLMRKAVSFVLTVKYVLRLLPPSKVYIISGLNYFSTAVAPSFHKTFSRLWFGMWRTSKD